MNSPKIVPRTSRRSKAVQLTCALTLNYIHEIIIFAQGGITAYNDKCNGKPKVKLVAHTYLALIQCVQFFSEVHAGMICRMRVTQCPRVWQFPICWLIIFAFFLIHSHHVKISVPYHVHTIHHHHVEKYPVYKKIEVPVIKEIKVPYPVHYPVKVP